MRGGQSEDAAVLLTVMRMAVSRAPRISEAGPMSFANPDQFSRRVTLIVAVFALLGFGSLGLTRYVSDYVLYRGFGPPVSSAAASDRGTIVTLGVRSLALGGVTVHALVYLPAEYARNPKRRYPVVYLLHGTPGDPRTAFVNSLHIAPRMDALIAAGTIKPMIIVMPPGSSSTYSKGTEWANGATAGTGWFDYLTHSVLQTVDSTYRTIATGKGRGIGGFSSGADAALNATILYPGRYGVAEGWSGDYRQTPSTVGGDTALVHRFSAIDTAATAAKALALTGTHVYLYAGRADRAMSATVAVGSALKQGGVATRLDVTGGGHSWMLWADRIDGALTYFSDHLRH